MSNTFVVQKKISLCINNKQVSTDIFEEAYNIDNFLVAYNSNVLTIINYDDGSIFSKCGKVEQVYDCGKFFVMSDIFNNMGIIRYDSSIIVPFNYLKLSINDSGYIYARYFDNPDSFSTYSHICHFLKSN